MSDSLKTSLGALSEQGPDNHTREFGTYETEAGTGTVVTATLRPPLSREAMIAAIRAGAKGTPDVDPTGPGHMITGAKIYIEDRLQRARMVLQVAEAITAAHVAAHPAPVAA